MRQFVTIAVNAFMELVRQPVFLLLMTASAAFEIFLATPYYFAFGDEPKLVKNSVLAVMLLAGLFGAVMSASASLAREIRAGTVLAVLSKPVGRAQFLLAKFAGLIVALTLMTYVNLVAALIAGRMVPAAVLILFALWILAALALACSTRFDMIPTLAICSAFFLVGLMSDYLFGRPADQGRWWGTVLYTLVPNWQVFWLADALETGKSTFHWGYVGKAFAYVVCYVGAVLTLAVMFFEERELS